MSIKIKNTFSLGVAISLILLIISLQFNNVNPINKKNPYPIAWDVYGYYLYLPATFIYDDLGLENEEWLTKTREKYNPSTTFYQVKSGQESKKVIVYNIGYALIFAPGFFIADTIAEYVGYERDGFSKPYQISLLLTALFFTILGIFLLRKLALYFFSDLLTSVILVAIVLGTNYFFQATYDGVMPHNILFTINGLILLYTIKWHQHKSYTNSILLATFIGLATICRPTELIWILIPVFWQVYDRKSLLEKIQLLLKNYIQLIVFSIIIIGFIFIQLLYYKYASGDFIVLNLHNEGFSFLKPYTIDFLISFKKGWLIYTPMMIFGIIGFYHLRKFNKNIWIALFLFFGINLYVVSSWDCWWYAASFSQRPMVETYAMMFLPLGYFFKWVIQSKYKIAVYSFHILLVLIIILNLFQIWQYKIGIIHAERMTKKYYLKIFGETSVTENDRRLLSIDRNQIVFEEFANYSENYTKKEIFNLDFENKKSESIIDTLASKGTNSFLLNEPTPFSPTFEKKYTDITNKNYIWIKASIWVYLTAPYTESNSALVISTETNGKSYKYSLTDYANFNIIPNKWTEIQLDYLTPELKTKNDIVKIYFWNMGSQPVLIDNFKVTIFEPKID